MYVMVTLNLTKYKLFIKIILLTTDNSQFLFLFEQIILDI